MVRRIALTFALTLVGLVQPSFAADRTAASCGSGDVQAAVNASADGDRVIIPAGNCTWTAAISISKAIKLTGAGTIPDIGAATTGGTTITLTISGAYDFFDLHESTAGNLEVSNLTLATNDGYRPTGGVIYIGPTSGGQPVILHHLTINDHITSGTLISAAAARGVIYRSVFQNDPASGGNGEAVLRCKMQVAAAQAAWASPSTMGAADTNGTGNLYFETNTVKNFNQAIDTDDGCRIVLRYNTWENSEILSHGRDTSPVGNRHWEVYNNTFRCTSQQNIGRFIFARGGTGVVTDNTIDDITSTCALSASQYPIVMSIWILRQAAAGCYPGPYPAPHQYGWGWTSGDINSQSLEPAYYWNNVRPTGLPVLEPFVNDFAPNQCGASAPSSIDYIQFNREYYLGPKPGYTKYQYPHPLASSTPVASGTTSAPAPAPAPAPVSPPPPSNLQVR
jgi:hypothetical protein